MITEAKFRADHVGSLLRPERLRAVKDAAFGHVVAALIRDCPPP